MGLTSGTLWKNIKNIIETARKTPADLSRPRDISACLIYWFLFVSYYIFPSFRIYVGVSLSFASLYIP